VKQWKQKGLDEVANGKTCKRQSGIVILCSFHTGALLAEAILNLAPILLNVPVLFSEHATDQAIVFFQDLDHMATHMPIISRYFLMARRSLTCECTGQDLGKTQ